MAPNRDDNSDEESSHPRTSRHGHRSKHDHPDDRSVDSGYGGSSATASPQLHQRALPRGQQTVPPPHAPRHEATHNHDSHNRAEAPAEDFESDSDYDPKSKYYIKVDDDTYRDMSFQGGAGQPTREQQHQSSKDSIRGERQESRDRSSARQHRSNHDKHRRPSNRDRSWSMASSDSSESNSPRHDRRHRQIGTHRYPDTTRSRRDSHRSRLSPVPSESTGEWQTSPERSQSARTRSRSRISNWRRLAADTHTHASDSEDTNSEHEGHGQDRHRAPLDKRRRRGSGSRASAPSERNRTPGRSASSQYRGAADMDDAWYKTVKERLVKGVDLKQVKKVGFDAAAVAAIKVAVGTQMPWKQRIPKTIAVGLAAAVTDFIVAKTSLKPKGMVGTMYARQLVEIALANLIINPVSNRMTGTPQKGKGQGRGSGSKSTGGVRSGMGRRK